MLILKNISAKVVEATGVTPWDMVLYVLDENLFVLKNFQVLLGSFLYYNKIIGYKNSQAINIYRLIALKAESCKVKVF